MVAVLFEWSLLELRLLSSFRINKACGLYLI